MIARDAGTSGFCAAAAPAAGAAAAARRRSERPASAVSTAETDSTPASASTALLRRLAQRLELRGRARASTSMAKATWPSRTCTPATMPRRDDVLPALGILHRA